MAFDGVTTAAVAAEIRDRLTGGYLSKIIQPEKDALLLTVKTGNGQQRLFLSAQASLPLIYLTDTNRAAPLTAPNFCMLLRKYIGGGKLLSVEQPSLERVLILHIERRDEMGDLRRWKLITEIMGKHSNIILTDEKDMIVDAVKHIPASVSSVREVLPGRQWFIPNTAGKRDPFSLDPSGYADTVCGSSRPLYKALYTSLTGLSPVMAEEVCSRAGLDGGRDAAGLSAAERETLFRTLSDLLSDVRNSAFRPEIVYQGKAPLEFAAVPLTQYRDLPKKSFASISGLLLSYYAEKEAVTRIRQKSADLRHITQTALERNTRTLALQEKQQKDTEKMDTYRLYGELLHTYGYGVEAQARSLTVTNYYTDEPVTIPLDPRLSAQENAEKYYARYTKLKRTAEALTEHMRETKERISHLNSVLTSLDLAADERDLSQIRQELTDSGYIRAVRSNKKQRPSAAPAPLRFRSSDGFEILVGKNNYQNEEVTFRLSDPNDWWFHAKNMPGSHVIVRSGGKELPDRTFEEAGRLAAYYSRGKIAPKVEIDYTLRKNLRKPAKASPGFVVYYTNYSLMAEPDITGIEQLPS